MAVNDPLIAAARAVRENAYAPYSHFKVGAAVQTTDGRIFTGCNVENVTFGLTRCAEQVAIVKAVSEGYRRFSRIAVVTESDPPAAPCGLCRQHLVEFCADLEIILANLDGDVRQMTLDELMPHAFRPSDLPQT